MRKKKLARMVNEAVMEAVDPVLAEFASAMRDVRRSSRPIFEERIWALESQLAVANQTTAHLLNDVQAAHGTPDGLRRTMSYVLDLWFQGRPYDGATANDLRRRVGLFLVDDKGNRIDDPLLKAPVPKTATTGAATVAAPATKCAKPCDDGSPDFPEKDGGRSGEREQST